MLIYMASPYAGNVENNVALAKTACRHVMGYGHVFFAPHLLYPAILDNNSPEEQKLGINMGLAMLRRCDELWLFDEIMSAGMQAEKREAERIGLPIQHVSMTEEPAHSRSQMAV